MKSGLVTCLSVSLHPGEISASTLTPTTGQWHIQHVGREMSAPRVAQGAQTAISTPSRRKDRQKMALVPKLWQPGPITILQPPPLPVPELCPADLKVNG